MRSRPRRWPIFTSLLVGLLLAVSMGWFVWHGLAPRRQAANEPALIEPPALELTGVDPAVVRAIETARRAVLESPASGPAWGQLGKTLLAHDFHRQAGTCLAQAQRLDPTEARWPYLEGVALASADPPDPAAALECFQRAVEVGGDVPRTLRLRLAEALLGEDRLPEAEQAFQHVLRSDPANARAHLGLARLALRRNDPGTSRSHLDRAASDPHAKKASRLLLVEVQQRLGKEVPADEVRATAALPADPAWPDPFWEEVIRLQTGMKVQLARAQRWLRQGRVPEALALLQKTTQDYPDSYYAWLMFGKALVKQRNLKNGEQALRTSLKLAPDSAEVQFQLGVALFLQGNVAGAEGQFRSALEINPNMASAHYNLGHCLVRKGDRAGGIEEFQTALRCQADYAEAHTMLGELFAGNGQSALALRHARLALQFNPADATARRVLIHLLRQIPFDVSP
ncbi:MAG TPA: tetratricopeptide repeat protein [Gemmataceae bacterium]|nr:tetratricopeptide repeat protein [Gemmataceae bacterium]